MNETENELKKRYLMRYQIAKRDVMRLNEQLIELRLNKISPFCVSGNGLPHVRNVTDLSGYIARLDELEQEILNTRYKRICAFMEIERAIEKMEDEKEKAVLTYRYLRGFDWDRIATEMGYGIRKIYYIHGDALKHFKICA